MPQSRRYSLIQTVPIPAVTRRLAWILAFCLLAAIATACTPQPAEPATATPNTVLTQAFAEALRAATLSVPTATLSPTPPALPAVFTSTILDKFAVPQTYIKDTCQYLKARWNPNNSQPGTVVMIIMYHSITEDYNPLLPDGSQVHQSDNVRTLEHAHEVGFETITAAQLADFLETNAPIPRRSLLLIVDDRKRKEYYETHFVPYLEQYDWQITNAWISATDTPDYLWKENQEVISAGWVDPQAHGVVHNIPAGEYSTDEFLRNEFVGSIKAIQEHFGKTPVGYIWPGGGFTKRAVELARESGYRVGFTTNPRGPVMFNWIPQAEQIDPAHTLWMPEIPAGDPLMTLPRYWSMDAAYRIDDVINIGDQAYEQAMKDRATELEYYDIVCKPVTGEIP